MDDGSVGMCKSAAARPLAPQFPRYQSQGKMNSMTCTDNWMPALLSVLPGYSDKFVPGCETEILPPTLLSLFNEEFFWNSHILNC